MLSSSVVCMNERLPHVKIFHTLSRRGGRLLHTHSADELNARHDSVQGVDADQVGVTAQVLWWRGCKVEQEFNDLNDPRME